MLELLPTSCLALSCVVWVMLAAGAQRGIMTPGGWTAARRAAGLRMQWPRMAGTCHLGATAAAVAAPPLTATAGSAPRQVLAPKSLTGREVGEGCRGHWMAACRAGHSVVCMSAGLASLPEQRVTLKLISSAFAAAHVTAGCQSQIVVPCCLQSGCLRQPRRPQRRAC